MLRGKNVKFRGGGASPVTPPPPVGPQYYAANAVGGSGSGLDAANPCLIATAWGLMAADAAAGLAPTLNLADGTYTGANSMIVPSISGTASALVVVRATNEGMVLIDGQSARIPINIQQKDYLNIIGVNAKKSSSDVVEVQGAIGCLIQRVCAWDAFDENCIIFANTYGVSNVFEDCAGWGTGRKAWLSYASAGPCVFRRCWGKFSNSTQVGPKQGGSLNYHSYNVIMENCLCTWDQTSMADPYTLQNNGVPYNQGALPVGGACNIVPLPYGVVQADHSCLVNSKFVAQSYAVLASDANDNTGLVWSAATTYPAAPRSQAIAIYGPTAYYSIQNGNINHRPDLNIGTWWNPIGPYSAGYSSMLGCIAYQKATYISLTVAQTIFVTLMDYVTMQDCVAFIPDDPSYGPTVVTGATRRPFNAANGVVHAGLVATNVTGFKGQASASAWGSDWVRTNSVESTTPAVLYTGAHKSDPAHPESLWNTTQGAQVRYRYVNGILTSTALWPWPMNQRIIDATTASGYTVEDINASMQALFGTFI